MLRQTQFCINYFEIVSKKFVKDRLYIFNKNISFGAVEESVHDRTQVSIITIKWFGLSLCPPLTT